MSFNIDKGDAFKVDKAVVKFSVGLGWDAVGTDFDLDAHVFGCVNQSGGPKFYNGGSHAVTYANSALVKNGAAFGSADGSIVSVKGDNRDGTGDGFDEEIHIDTSKLPAQIEELLVFLTIHKAKERSQHFGKVKGAHCVITDLSNTKELCRYNLGDEFVDAISVQVGSFAKDASGGWVFTAVGAGFKNEGLAEVLTMLS